MTRLFSFRIAVALATVIALQGQTGGSRQFAIVDPVLQMPAWTFPLPSGWNATGTMLPPPSCSTATAPVLKIVSPDGRAGAYLLPTFNWAWGAASRSGGDCLPWHAPISAREFLTFFAASEKVNILRKEPVTGLDTLRQNMAQYGGMRRQGRSARAVRGQRATMDERLIATVGCQTLTFAAVGQQHRCSTTVIRWFAPAGKLDALVPTFESMKLALNPQWMSAWQAKMVAQSSAVSQQETTGCCSRATSRKRVVCSSRKRSWTISPPKAGRVPSRSPSTSIRDSRTATTSWTTCWTASASYNGNTRVSAGNLCPNRQTY